MAMIPEHVLIHWRRFDAAVEATLDADFATARAAIERAALPRPELNDAQLSVFDFEQFVIGTVMLHRAFVAGEVSEMGDWIQWALTDVPTDDFKHEMYQLGLSLEAQAIEAGVEIRCNTEVTPEYANAEKKSGFFGSFCR